MNNDKPTNEDIPEYMPGGKPRNYMNEAFVALGVVSTAVLIMWGLSYCTDGSIADATKNRDRQMKKEQEKNIELKVNDVPKSELGTLYRDKNEAIAVINQKTDPGKLAAGLNLVEMLGYN